MVDCVSLGDGWGSCNPWLLTESALPVLTDLLLALEATCFASDALDWDAKIFL